MKSVVISGSRRFASGMKKFAKELKALGVYVYEPIIFLDSDSWMKLEEKHQQMIFRGLANDHFQKIRKADVMYVFNKGGYSGPSVTLEIGFAHALNKQIYAYSHDEEWGRDLLFEEVTRSAKKLYERLK